MKFSVCMETVFGRDWTKNMEANIALVKEAGYDAIEFLTWWDKDTDKIKAITDDLGLEIAAILTNCGCMGDPKVCETFLEDLKKSVDMAHKLNCPSVIGQSGLVRMFLPEADFWKNMINAFRQGAKILEDGGVTMVVEPVNTKVDHAGVFLATSRDSFYLTSMVGSHNVKILYDIYHMQITEGDILHTVEANLDAIGHMHAAGIPGRNELTKSEIDYAYVFQKLDQMGYTGYMGMEYRPMEDVLTGLKLAKAMYGK